MYRFLPILLAFTLAACRPSAPDEPVTDSTEQETMETPPSPPEESASEAGIDLPTLLDNAFQRDESGHLTILDRLNEPAHVDLDTQRNRHAPSQTDTLRTRHYDNLSLTVYQVAGGKEILKSITVTGGRYATDDSLRVGTSREEVESTWGAPSHRRNGTYVYELEGPMPPYVDVSFDADTVSSMQWNYPID